MKDCPEDKILNPETNRCINDTPSNKKKIEKYLKNIKTHNLIMTNEREAPSMGPVIFPDYYEVLTTNNNKRGEIREKNYRKIFTYNFKRLKEIKKNPDIPISKLEYNDLIKLGKLSAEYLFNDEIIKKDLYDKAINLLKEVKEIYKNANKINDIPEPKIIGFGFHIESSRYEMRKSLNGLHDSIINLIDDMTYSIDNNDFEDDIINKGTISLNLERKEAIDELIKLKIFRKSEIYSIVFQNENIWDDIKKLYKKYNQLSIKYKNNNK
jgi:hypothetical protein